MLFDCPHCKKSVRVDQDPPPVVIDCDECGSTFPSEPEETLAQSVRERSADGVHAVTVHACPHCQNKVRVSDQSPESMIECDGCGGSFPSLLDASFECDADTRRVLFAHFELLEEVGSGSYGVVWKARDTRLDRIVALKIPRSERLTPGEVERFLAEAQTSAQLRHPGIVSIHDTGRVGHTIYIATHFVEGSALDEWLRYQTVSPSGAAEICAQVADALHHAHESGVIHRDIKPSNIMMDQDGRPYLTDFGLAKRESVDATIAVEGSLLGTPAYMSPEQARGEAHWADRRSDLYSLGVILFQMLTRERPFRGSRQMILQQVIESEAPHPRQLNNSIPEDLDTICFKCLEKLPARRYETASEVADELRRFLRGEPIRARAITRTQRAWRWCRRNPVIAGLVAALMLVLVVGCAVSTAQWMRANVNAKSAIAEAQRASQSALAAKAARESTEQYLYVAHMNLAQQAYELADPQRVLEILERHKPSADGGIDRRSFEWFYWKRRAQRWSKSLVHDEPLHDVAISPDGSMVATTSAAGRIAIWDTVSGEQIHTLPGHDGDLYVCVWSPSSPTTLVSAGGDRTIRCWDAVGGTQLGFVETDKSVFAMSFSQDGSTLVTGGADTVLHRWDVDFSGEGELFRERNEYQGHIDFVYGVAISADQSLLASCGLDRTVRIWNAEDGTLLHTLEGHSLETWSVAFSPDGSIVASASADHRIGLWQVQEGRLVTMLQGHTDRIRDVAFSPDGNLLVSASHDRTIRLWDMSAQSEALPVRFRNLDRRDHHFFERMQLPNSGFPKDEFKGHAGHVTALDWSRNGKTLVSASVDGTARLWNVAELQQRSVLRDHLKTVNALAVSSDGRSLISGGNDRTVRFWNLATMQQIGEAVPHEQMVLAVATSPDGKMYATGSYDSVVRLGALSGVDPIGLEGHAGPIASVAFSSDSASLASGSHDGTVRVWDVETGQLRFTSDLHEDRVQAVQFLPDGSIASGGRDHTVRIWSPVDGTVRAELVGHTAPVWALAVSPDGKLLASVGEDRSLRLWDLTEAVPSEVRAIDAHAEPVRCVAFCPDGKTVATGSDDKTIKLWDVATGEPKSTFKGHKYRVWSLGFTPDSEKLLSASLVIRVWDAPR